jgi:hypothetical protein
VPYGRQGSSGWQWAAYEGIIGLGRANSQDSTGTSSVEVTHLAGWHRWELVIQYYLEGFGKRCSISERGGW